MSSQITAVIEKIKKLNTSELIQVLDQNGLNDCCHVIIDHGINGESFLNISEGHLSQWRNELNFIQRKRLWSVIQLANQRPQDFYAIPNKRVQDSSADGPRINKIKSFKNKLENILTPVKDNSSGLDDSNLPLPPRPPKFDDNHSKTPFQNIPILPRFNDTHTDNFPPLNPRPPPIQPRPPKLDLPTRNLPAIPNVSRPVEIEDYTEIDSELKEPQRPPVSRPVPPIPSEPLLLSEQLAAALLSRETSKITDILKVNLPSPENQEKFSPSNFQSRPLPPIPSPLSTKPRKLSRSPVRLPEPLKRLPEQPVRLPEPPVRLPEPPVRLPEPSVRLPEPPIRLPDAPVRLPEAPVRLPEPPIRLPEQTVRLSEPRNDYFKQYPTTSFVPSGNNYEDSDDFDDDPDESQNYDYLEPEIPDFKTEPWYRDVDRKEARRILQGSVDGTFIIRPSRKQNFVCCMTISYNNIVFNVAIMREVNGKLTVGNKSEAKNFFGSVQEIVKYYKNNALRFSVPSKKDDVLVFLKT